MQQLLLDAYDKMNDHYGDLGWWPAVHGWEVAVGAILTQNTTWRNTSKAIEALRQLDLLRTPAALLFAESAKIENAIKPCGYFRQKTKKLKILAAVIYHSYGDDIELLKNREANSLRADLLRLWGIGNETADSILLYALGKPVIVVDAYTIRILARHGFCDAKAGYNEVQSLLEQSFAGDVARLQQLHALFVCLGKDFCRKSFPRCAECPLRGISND